MLQTEFEISLVLRGKRRSADIGSRQIDALVLPQYPAVQHFTDHISAGNLLYDELNAAIGKQNVLARFYVAGKNLVGGGNTLSGAHHIFRRDDDRLPLLQSHCHTVFQPASPDLRPLQVLQNADGTAELAGHFAQAPNYSGMVVV